ncbi:MAG TPA: hypothetical protein VGM25_02970 [Caulobacteraceae bacterium]
MRATFLIGLAVVFATFAAMPERRATAAPSTRAGVVKKAPTIKPEPLEAGAEYFAVRAWLIRQGWKPVITSYKFRDDPDRGFAEERLYWKRGAVEAENCYTDAPGGCELYFKRRDICLHVRTVGEYIPNRASPSVDSWDHECPEGDDSAGH